MKSIASVLTVILLTFSILFSGCTEDTSLSSPAEIITRGQWTVEYFYAGQDQTSSYSSFTFVFKSGGVVTSENGSVQDQGNWRIIRNVGGDVLEMEFHTQQLQALSEAWPIMGMEGYQLSFKRSEDHLRLRKI
jgi:hypothetical protein